MSSFRKARKMEPHLKESFSAVWKRQFWQSIKAFETEDKIDIYFFRPAGFALAKVGVLLKLSPTFLTLLGMVLGIISGFFFYANQSVANLCVASAFFVFAGILDSADGQLARLTGQFSQIGLVLDGICDNIVFIAAYVGSILTIQPYYGGRIWILGVLAGVCHSAQSAILDFYNREYLYFGYGLHHGDYWNPSVEDADRARAACPSANEKIAWWLRRTWIRQQQLLATRTVALRSQWKTALLGERSTEFQMLYRDHNRFVLRLWRPLGANFHTIMIIVFAFLRRFDLYLLLIDVLLLTIWLFIVREIQAFYDRRFLRCLAEKRISRICT